MRKVNGACLLKGTFYGYNAFTILKLIHYHLVTRFARGPSTFYTRQQRGRNPHLFSFRFQK